VHIRYQCNVRDPDMSMEIIENARFITLLIRSRAGYLALAFLLQ
jgi:hypothetical protein